MGHHQNREKLPHGEMEHSHADPEAIPSWLQSPTTDIFVLQAPTSQLKGVWHQRKLTASEN